MRQSQKLGPQKISFMHSWSDSDRVEEHLFEIINDEMYM